jgi:hypothetical protein
MISPRPYPHETDKSDDRNYLAPTDKTDNYKTDNTILPYALKVEATQKETIGPCGAPWGGGRFLMSEVPL